MTLKEQTWPFHPISEIFPLLSEDRAAELAADIKARGLLDPITMYEGMILDGRNRYRACIAAGILWPKTVAYEGDDPVGWVLSKNLNRRHLTDDQRAMAAVSALPMLEAEAEKRRRAAISQARSGETPPKLAVSQQKAPESRDAAAEKVGVSRSKVARAKAVTVADSELAKEVATGSKTMRQAEDEIKKRKSQRPGLNPQAPTEGMVVQPPRPPRPDPTLHDRLYRTIGGGPPPEEWRQLAGEVKTATLDLPQDAIKKLTRTLSSENGARQDLARALKSLLDRSYGTP